MLVKWLCVVLIWHSWRLPDFNCGFSLNIEIEHKKMLEEYNDLFPPMELLMEKYIDNRKFYWSPMGGTIFTHKGQKYVYVGKSVEERVVATPLGGMRYVALGSDALNASELQYENRESVEYDRNHPAFGYYFTRLNEMSVEGFLATKVAYRDRDRTLTNIYGNDGIRGDYTKVFDKYGNDPTNSRNIHESFRK